MASVKSAKPVENPEELIDRVQANFGELFKVVEVPEELKAGVKRELTNLRRAHRTARDRAVMVKLKKLGKGIEQEWDPHVIIANLKALQAEVGKRAKLAPWLGVTLTRRKVDQELWLQLSRHLHQLSCAYKVREPKPKHSGDYY